MFGFILLRFDRLVVVITVREAGMECVMICTWNHHNKSHWKPAHRACIFEASRVNWQSDWSYTITVGPVKKCDLISTLPWAAKNKHEATNDQRLLNGEKHCMVSCQTQLGSPVLRYFG